MTNTSLVPVETAVRFTPDHRVWGSIDSQFQANTLDRHRDWHAERQRIFTAMQSAYEPLSRVVAFKNCGVGGWVLRREDRDNEYAIVPKYCHDRFCRPCSRQRAWTIRKNLSKHLPTHPCRFVTLTLRSGTEPLVYLLDKLRTSFTLLRKSDFWKAHVLGGVAFLEVKWSETKRRWHPHLHLITHGKFIPQRELSELWQAITDTSFMVDIRLVRDPKTVLKYITKYVTKGMCDNTASDPDRLLECLLALKGRRLCGAFGDWRKLKLLETETEGDWSLLCPLHELAALCREGDPDALLVAQHLVGAKGDGSKITFTARDPPEFLAVELLYTDHTTPPVAATLPIPRRRGCFPKPAKIGGPNLWQS